MKTHGIFHAPESNLYSSELAYLEFCKRTATSLTYFLHCCILLSRKNDITHPTPHTLSINMEQFDLNLNVRDKFLIAASNMWLQSPSCVAL